MLAARRWAATPLAQLCLAAAYQPVMCQLANRLRPGLRFLRCDAPSGWPRTMLGPPGTVRWAMAITPMWRRSRQ